MEDEIIEAAASAISCLGEVALRAGAAELVTRARSIAVPTEGASGETTQAASRLREEAAALEEAGSEGRKEAVSSLLRAASALEALGVGLNEIGNSAGDLARQCGEYQEAAAAIDKVRQAVDDEMQLNRPAPWWLFWRDRQPHVTDIEKPLLAAGFTPAALQALGVTGPASTAIDFLQKKASPSHLLQLANNVIDSAWNKLPDQSLGLATARDALQEAQGAINVKDAVNALKCAATNVQESASAIRKPAKQLVAACQDYLKAFEAMNEVQRAAKERARQRERKLPPPPGPGQGDRLSSWLGYALGGSLSLVPYLAATNADHSAQIGHGDRSNISFVLSVWWTVMASGAVCSSYARSWIELCYAQLAARVGIYGMNIFTIYFLYWIVGSSDTETRCDCLWLATILHFLLLVVACWRRVMDV